MPQDQDLRRALIEGLCDAGGFFFGALAGWWIGRAFGFDVVGAAGYGFDQMVGLLFVLVGCGLGRWASQTLKGRLLGGPTR